MPSGKKSVIYPKKVSHFIVTSKVLKIRQGNYLKNSRPLCLRFKAERGIPMSMLVIQIDANKWPVIYITGI